MSWGTEARRRRAPWSAAAAVAAAACFGAAAPVPAPAPAPAPAAAPAPADGPATVPIAGPLELRDAVARAERALERAAGAVRGEDAGRVSLILARADEELETFENASRLPPLAAAFAEARAAIARDEPSAAVAPLRRVRTFIPALGDYTVTTQVEEASRAALLAAEGGNAALCLEATARTEAAILAPVLLARVREARAAVVRGRAAMVRHDMQGGAEAIAAARRAIDGLRFAGALSRSRFAVGAGAELLRAGAILAARDQVRRGLRDLRAAGALAAPGEKAPLEAVDVELAAIWRKMSRRNDEHPPRLDAVAAAIETVRARQK